MIKTKNRLLYIDNLRLFMIILVVMMHLAVTFSGLGNWYYTESNELGTVQLIIFGFFQSFLQGFFMGILFLIAGYFIPSSYDKKGFSKFIKERLIRLGIPTLLYMIFIHPFIMLVLLNNGNFFSKKTASIYLNHFVFFNFISASGPLWFAFALLFFSLIYALYRKFIKPIGINKDKKFPKTSKIILLILIISFFAFVIRMFLPIGTSVINMQLCYFSQYIILFIIGIECRRSRWFEKLTYSSGKTWLISGLFLGFTIWTIIMLTGGALDGNLDKFNGGLTWQNAAYALWESFAAVSMSIGLISLFKEKYNTQNKLIKTMSENTFSVYVFHAPIIIGISLLFKEISLIPIIKFIISTIISIPICFLFSNYIIRKIPFLRKFLV